jgi:UDP-D-galactose:(glucosyl)LPS alpha-1,3-D-galactosyltransferase
MSDLPPLVCAIDDRYRTPLAVLMESMAAAHGPALGQLQLIVLHHGLSAESQSSIGRHAELLGLAVQLRTVPRPSARFPVSEWVSEAVYLRLSVGDAIRDHRVVLYLDVDLLVLDDIRDLLRSPLDGALFGAVRDAQHPVIGRGISLPGWRSLGIPAGRDYFNSGVLLLDLDRCRDADLFNRCRRFLNDYPQHARFWDQDALNWAADDRWLRLDRRWNTFPLSALSRVPEYENYAEDILPVRQLIADEETAAILHFAGPDKPWRPGFPDGEALATYQRFAQAAAARQGGQRNQHASIP